VSKYSEACAVAELCGDPKPKRANVVTRAPVYHLMTRKPGRGVPTKCTPELVASLMDWLREGRLSLAAFCRKHHMEPQTVHYWKQADPEFAAEYAKARAIGCEAMEEERLELAYLEPADMVDVQWRKLQIETIDKTLANRDPARYGSKQQLGITGTLTLEALVLKSLPEPVEAK
jgi:hypothetical protein